MTFVGVSHKSQTCDSWGVILLNAIKKAQDISFQTLSRNKKIFLHVVGSKIIYGTVWSNKQ